MGGDIGRGQPSLETLDVEHHAVLAVDACHAARDALERSAGDADEIARDEMAFLHVHLPDMLVVKCGGADQGHHVAFCNGDGRIHAELIGLEVVIIIGDVARGRVVVYILFGLFARDIGEEEVEERDEHAAALAVLVSVLPDHGEVGIHLFLHKEVGHLLGMTVEDAEDEPLLLWRWDILYRHPCL